MFQELRYAARLIHRSPGFVAAAVITLAIGIGATTAIFTLTDAVLLHPLDVHDPDNLVALQTKDFRGETSEGFLYEHFLQIRQTLGPAVDLAIEEPSEVIVTTPGGLSRRRGAFVSANYFDVLGRPPILGRGFVEDDDRLGAEPVVILGHALWRSAFNGDRNIVGSRVIVSTVPMTVAGIAAPRQRGVDLEYLADVFLPAHVIQRTTTLPGNTGNYFFQDGSPGWSPGAWWRVFGRLKPGVSREAATAMAVCRGCKEQKLTLVPAQRAAIASRLRGDVSRFSAVLALAVAIVLLMACANLAGLILARTERRRREIGVRIALGASRARLAAHLLMECALVAILGCLSGVVLSRWILGGLVSFELPGLIPLGKLELPLNGRVLAFAIAASVVSALLIGLTPARAAARTDVVSALKHTDPLARRGGARYLLVATHVALSVILVFGAGLFVRSLQTALGVDVGFDPRRIIVADPDVQAARFDDARKFAYFDAAVKRISSVPGVESVSYGTSAFFMAGNSTPWIVVDGQELRLPRNVMEFQGGPGYVRTMGFRLTAGRDLEETDGPASPRVVLVNVAFAKRFWPDGNAVGHRVSLKPAIMDATIVGVVEDVKYTLRTETPRLAVTGAWKQSMTSHSSTGLMVRSDNPRRVLATLQQAIPAIDRTVPVTSVRVLEELVERALMPQRLGSWLLGSFSVVAILLAVVGIYGLVAFLVAQRTHEIGIRMALGAERRHIAGLVLAGVFGAVAAGALTGTALVWWLSRFATKFLFGIGPHDTIALAATLGVLLLTAVGAAAFPARRATRVDPMVALRAE